MARNIEVTEMGIQRETCIKHTCGHWGCYVGTSPTYLSASDRAIHDEWLKKMLVSPCNPCMYQAENGPFITVKE